MKDNDHRSDVKLAGLSRSRRSAWKATDQLPSPFGRLLLGLPRGWTDRRKENAIATSLLMFAPVAEAMRARDGLEAGRFALDVGLFKDFYQACPKAMRPRLLASPPAKYLPPLEFRQMFKATYGQRGIGLDDMARLASTLEAFLCRQPRLASDFEDIILGMLRSRTLGLCLQGLSMAGSFLTRLAPKDRARIRSRLSSSNTALRHNALLALRFLLARRDEIDPALLAFCTSDALLRKVAELAEKEPDPANRAHAARLLKLGRRLAAAGAPGPRTLRGRPARTQQADRSSSDRMKRLLG